MIALQTMVLAAAAATASPQGMPSLHGLAARSTGPAVLTVNRAQIRLEPISVQELVGDAEQPLSGAAVRTDFDGIGLVGRGGISPAPLPTRIRRPLRGLWSLAVPNGVLRQSQVTVALEGVDGSPGVLSASDDPRVQLPVAVLQLSPRTVSMDAENTQLEGDVVLEFPTAALGSATHYRGRLVIRVEGY